MSDARLRELERAADLGDPQAVVALARARCRAEGHDLDPTGVYMRFDERAFLERGDLSSAQTFDRCRRCGEDVPRPSRGRPNLHAAGSALGFAVEMLPSGDPFAIRMRARRTR